MLRSTTILFVLLILSSCAKDASTEYEDARNQLIGDWQLIEKSVTTDVGQESTTIEKTDLISFANDGTGVRLTSFNGVRNFEWIYQLSPEKISIISKSDTTFQGFITAGENRHYDILENNTETQQWIGNDNVLLFIDGMSQIAPRVTTWEMIRL